MKIILLAVLLLAVFSNIGCASFNQKSEDNCTEKYLNSHLKDLQSVCERQ